ncbi:hypothetical protein [Nocardia asteroides]|uniref:hypothetical protein n=1 Tax=Nocardia asteroides TaxID=1824 RepID=UPI001E5E583F|nr:hypothetical protein [Nocardia asteroides]UGT61866.1 hypothetical protein LTT61_00475 [Nocardia asteroides]
MSTVRDKNPDRNERDEFDLTPVLALAVSAYGATGSLPVAAAVALVAIAARRVEIG